MVHGAIKNIKNKCYGSSGVAKTRVRVTQRVRVRGGEGKGTVGGEGKGKGGDEGKGKGDC